MKQTAFERGEFVLNKIAAEWNKNNKSVSAAITAAGEVGRAHVGNLIGYDQAELFIERGFGVRLIDEKHWSEVYGAFQNGRASLVTNAELREQYFPSAAANDNDRFNITWFDDVGQTVIKDELVKGLLGSGEFSLFVAKPGTAKSVLLVDIGCHIAAGTDWHGRNVKQGLVVFFAAERKPLTERRIAAWAKKHGVTNIPFAVVGGKLDLTTGLVGATALANTIAELEAKSGHSCVLIILDTVTRTFGPGDQHQSRDMQRYIQSVDAMTRATGAHVAAIHHSPWSDDRGKGAIDLDGAVDVSFVITVRGTGLAKTFTLKCTGSNDGEEGVITSFRLESVALGTDADGNITTAPVVAQVDASKDSGSNLRSHAEKALEALEQAIEEHGQRVPDKSLGFPDGTVAVAPDTWRDRYYADCRDREPQVADDTISKRYRRAVRELIDGKQVGRTGEWNWIVQPQATLQ
jgi:AAA domain-containing protein